MLKPSYSELMDKLNDDMDLDNQITSRYTIVIAAAKRARQIIDGAPCYKAGAGTDKAVSIAVNEMSKGLIIIHPEGTTAEPELEIEGAETFAAPEATPEGAGPKAETHAGPRDEHEDYPDADFDAADDGDE